MEPCGPARGVPVNLKDKVCLITGGTSGIGAATASALAERGARIAAVARGTAPSPAKAAAAFGSSGESLAFFSADVSDPPACRRCVEQVAALFGRIDVVVHSAGGPVPGGLHSVSEEDWMHAFAVHVHSVFHLTRAATPYIARQGEGAIVLLGSAAGLRGCLGALAYGVAKGALPQFARNLARELADQHIRVNCISPGIIRTPFQNFLTPEQAENNVRNRIPLRREGSADDVARIILAVIENDFITGENIVVDGGMTMRIV